MYLDQIYRAVALLLSPFRLPQQVSFSTSYSFNITLDPNAHRYDDQHLGLPTLPVTTVLKKFKVTLQPSEAINCQWILSWVGSQVPLPTSSMEF